jgi:hypothetical protein
MLRKRALDRRRSIALDGKDIPIEPTYISQVKKAKAGITVLSQIKVAQCHSCARKSSLI